MQNSELSIIYTTIDNLEKAKSLSHYLIKEKLIACANILPIIASLYEWQNEIIESNEYALIIKTKTELVNETILRVRQLHPYKNPAIFELAVGKHYSNDFIDWVNQQTK